MEIGSGVILDLRVDLLIWQRVYRVVAYCGFSLCKAKRANANIWRNSVPVIVEPGPFRTDWAGRSLKTPKKPVDAYAETAIARRQAIQGVSGQPGRRSGSRVRGDHRHG